MLIIYIDKKYYHYNITENTSPPNINNLEQTIHTHTFSLHYIYHMLIILFLAN
uniref:Uncharacterized protein n=1 Tax=Medicago truncatula TaxID=3880 RepID=B7FFT7_MEDTR|nr:unknown [Medicago truncatula]